MHANAFDGGQLNNRLLRALPHRSLAKLGAISRPIELKLGAYVSRQDSVVDRICFVDRGLVSLVKVAAGGRAVEIGSVGPEGLTDPLSLLGLDDAAFDAMVQIEGNGFAISKRLLTGLMADDSDLSRLIKAYAHFSQWQLGQISACNRLHSLEQRCCRWILTACESALSARFFLTHEFLAAMLGVPRPGVSRVAKALQDGGYIEYARGDMRVLNAEGLMHEACECYVEMIRKFHDITN